jgi:hypothetical protein
MSSTLVLIQAYSGSDLIYVREEYEPFWPKSSSGNLMSTFGPVGYSIRPSDGRLKIFRNTMPDMLKVRIESLTSSHADGTEKRIASIAVVDKDNVRYMHVWGSSQDPPFEAGLLPEGWDPSAKSVSRSKKTKRSNDGAEPSSRPAKSKPKQGPSSSVFKSLMEDIALKEEQLSDDRMSEDDLDEEEDDGPQLDVHIYNFAKSMRPVFDKSGFDDIVSNLRDNLRELAEIAGKDKERVVHLMASIEDDLDSVEKDVDAYVSKMETGVGEKYKAGSDDDDDEEKESDADASDME